jgi:tetratricopeptide (TPR) repeat protein
MRWAMCAMALVFAMNAHAGVPEALTASYAAEATGDYATALKALDGLTVADDAAYVVTLRKAWLKYLQGSYADSVTSYQAAAAQRPSSVEALLGETLPLMALRRWTEAKTACDAALVLAPGNYTAASRLAWVLFSLGRYAEAQAKYEALVRLYPSDLDMRAGLGWTLLKLGKPVEARAHFAWVLQISPSNTSAAQGLTAAGG